MTSMKQPLYNCHCSKARSTSSEGYLSKILLDLVSTILHLVGIRISDSANQNLEIQAASWIWTTDLSADTT